MWTYRNNFLSSIFARSAKMEDKKLLIRILMPSSFYTRTGDDGYSGLLGEGRVPKEDPRLEAVGAVDEANAALGVARALCQAPESADLLLQVQRDLYGLMAELAATPENAARFRVVNAERVAWLETQVDAVTAQVEVPKEFIVPGDTAEGAFLDLARTVVRRAERRVAELVHGGLENHELQNSELQNSELQNSELLRYLNRLSSLCFVLELREHALAIERGGPLGSPKITFAKTEKKKP
jgi:cob(I)alamin adenosyltransferase